jgi:hypothetical protein
LIDNVSTILMVAFLGFAVLVFLWRRSIEGRARVFLILGLCLLSLISTMRGNLLELVLSYKEVRVRLQTLERSLSEISRALETLVVVQQITELEHGDTLVLEYEPIPQSIRIILGPLTHSPTKEYGYSLEGRRIRIIDPCTLEQVSARLPGGLSVEYVRRLDLD